MAGKYRSVKKGEWLASIAYDEKFIDGGKAIWDDPKNAHVRETHPNPNLLCEHVRMWIPEKNGKEETSPVDNKYKFEMKSPPKAMLRIKLLDMDGEPVKDEPYRLIIDFKDFIGRTYSGPPMSDANGTWEPGIIQHEIPVTANFGSIELTSLGQVFDFKIGYLREIDPDDKNYDCATKGVQARLNNLGFGSGPIDGIVGEKTRAAVHAFQDYLAKNKTKIGYDSGPIDGIPGPITKGALKRFHGQL